MEKDLKCKGIYSTCRQFNFTQNLCKIAFRYGYRAYMGIKSGYMGVEGAFFGINNVICCDNQNNVGCKICQLFES